MEESLSDALNLIAANQRLMNMASNAVRNFLLEMRDSGTSLICPGFGLVIRNPDGSESSRVRMHFDASLRIALRTIAGELRNSQIHE